ncbi:MAG: hypothetical protein U0O29_08500, partial [Oscillospiraceae bacterium]
IVVESFTTPHHYCPMSVQPLPALTVTFDCSNSQRTKIQRNYGSFSAETSRVYRTGNQKF